MHHQSFPRETLKRLAQRGAADVEPLRERLVGQHLSRSELQASDLAHEQLVRTRREGARDTLPLRYEIRDGHPGAVVRAASTTLSTAGRSRSCPITTR